MHPNEITLSHVKSEAEKFLASYHPSLYLPIPIEKIVESKLNIEIIPVKNLRRQYDVDGSLDSSLSRVFIGLDLYTGNENRTRFTLAHEIGHLTYMEKNLKD